MLFKDSFMSIMTQNPSNDSRKCFLFFLNKICKYSLLILITCTETLQKASHLGFRIRPLTLAYTGSEQYVALSLPHYDSYTLIPSAVN